MRGMRQFERLSRLCGFGIHTDDKCCQPNLSYADSPTDLSSADVRGISQSVKAFSVLWVQANWHTVIRISIDSEST